MRNRGRGEEGRIAVNLKEWEVKGLVVRGLGGEGWEEKERQVFISFCIPSSNLFILSFIQSVHMLDTVLSCSVARSVARLLAKLRNSISESDKR